MTEYFQSAQSVSEPENRIDLTPLLSCQNFKYLKGNLTNRCVCLDPKNNLTKCLSTCSIAQYK